MISTLVYVSTMLHAATEKDLHDLLVECRDQNQVLGVTGLLLYSDGNVVQLLEGEDQTVQALYARIARDPRHHRVLVIWTSTADHRRFPDWTMGFADLSRGPADAPTAPADRSSHLTSTTLRGTTEQQHYVQRRSAALQKVLASGEQQIRALSLLVHGYNPELVRRADGTSDLCCGECGSHRDGPAPFPCSAALGALQDVEAGSSS